MTKFVIAFIFSGLFCATAMSQNSVARQWNEVQLAAIRQDLARPPVQARNLFHVAIAMYDAWSIYKPTTSTYLLGKTVNNILHSFSGNPPLISNDTLASQKMAISYAAYRVLRSRYASSPNATTAIRRFDSLMLLLNYDTSIHSTDYIIGTPAALGNYIAQQVLLMGINDGANQTGNYANQYYNPVNNLLYTNNPGSSNMANPNRWQPLNIITAFDQNGNPVSSNQNAVCHEWGNVLPFSLDTATASLRNRNGNNYRVFMDPGGPTVLDTTLGNDASSMHYKWAYEMVAVWSSMLDPDDATMIDISPKGRGNLTTFPLTNYDQYSYYNYYGGGDNSLGHTINPVTNLPYVTQMVKRGDYTRVVSQYWADGPQSETPPGHWFVVLNNVSDHPLFVKKFKGVGPTLSNLEWDVKSYFSLGGALHDAAIAAWALKGWYDSPRPISVIRKMAEYGQSTNASLPHYHPAGLPLINGYIELIGPTDSLATLDPSNINKIKIKAWKGHSFINYPEYEYAGVGWILAENWMPYQSKTFVTPPFAGYVSGHSTYSRAGAELMTSITGSAFFPGGLYETVITPSSNFLKLEMGPSATIKLQWATYVDASNEASLSRIWGGIHPPTDDAPGRQIGKQIAAASLTKAESYFSNQSLPINLISFTSTEKNCTLELSFTGTRETNVKRYEIWRSSDGYNFTTKIGALIAQNNYGLNSYTIKDIAPNKINFYTLIEVDNNNTKHTIGYLFKTLSNCKEMLVNELIAFPNPVVYYVQLQIRSANTTSNTNLKIVDIFGKTILQQKINLIKGENIKQLDFSTYATGTYAIFITDQNGIIATTKVIKTQ
jgi:hypothetical protein